MIFEVLVKDVLLLMIERLDLDSLGRMAQVSRVARRLVKETQRYQAIRQIEESNDPSGEYNDLGWRANQACKTDNLELLQYCYDRHYGQSHLIHLLIAASAAQAKYVTQWVWQKYSGEPSILLSLIAAHYEQGNLDFAQWLCQLGSGLMTPSRIQVYLRNSTDPRIISWLRSLLPD